MQDKLTKTGTMALMALMGFSAFVTAQTMSRVPSETVKRGPIVMKPMVQLGCATKAKEMNETITVTNTTAQTIKKGTMISYTIYTQKGSFKLSSDLAPNANLVQASVPYQGNQGCKAWY